jgi:hypothetical protein
MRVALQRSVELLKWWLVLGTFLLGGGIRPGMAQVISHQPLTSEARVLPQVTPCGICYGQSGTGTGFSLEFFGFPLSISFHHGLSILIYHLGLNSSPISVCSSDIVSPHRHEHDIRGGGERLK